jgi:hypothetical protein
MFSKSEIEDLIGLAKIGVNYMPTSDCCANNLKLALVEAKMCLDRWRNWGDTIIVHSSKQEKMRTELNLTIDEIWGCKIHYCDECPIDTGIFLASNANCKDNTECRHIALFTV